MTGHERDAIVGLAVSATTNGVLTLLLARSFGTIGAAVATATSVAVCNILMWRFVRRRLAFGYSLRDTLGSRAQKQLSD